LAQQNAAPGPGSAHTPGHLVQSAHLDSPRSSTITDVKSLQEAQICSGVVPKLDLRFVRFAPPQATISMSNEGGWCWAEFSVNSSPVSFSGSLTPTTFTIAPETNVIVPPTHGTILIGPVNGETRLAYRPSPGFTGADEFRIKFFDIINAAGVPLTVHVIVAR
jgi:hypothetical protein